MKRLISVILVTMVISISAQAKYSGGSGTPDDPYQIASADDLLALGADANDHNQCFIMTADIDLSAYVFHKAVIAGAPNHYPQEPFNAVFSGTFDSDGHKISNMSIVGKGHKIGLYLGLFGFVGNSTIKGIRLENVKITGESDSGNIGGLAGHCYHSSISNCSVTGEITGGWGIGGLIGQSINNVINNCSFTGNISGTNLVGGLVGYCWDGRRTFAPNTDFSNFGDINNCYTSGTVTGGDKGYAIGGLLGGFGSDINNCYSACKVTAGKISDVGGQAGVNYCTTKNSYFLLGHGPNDGIGLPLTDSQMKRRASFVGWDFVGESANGTEDIWMISEGVDYPKLAWTFDCNRPIAGRK